MSSHFFIVGAQRSGTTYLYSLLADHPEIEMAQPVRPEPKHFLDKILVEKGIEYYEKKYFGNKPAAKALGEKSTSYIESPQAAKAIASFYPDAKIIISLRNPIDRAVSNYCFSASNRIESAPIEIAFKDEQARMDNYDPAKFSTSPFAYLQRGLYCDYIKTYQNIFGPKNVKLLLFEKMIDPGFDVSSVFDFLNVDPSFKPSAIGTAVNAGKTSVELSEEMLQYLKNYFAEPNKKLSKQFDLDISLWDQS